MVPKPLRLRNEVAAPKKQKLLSGGLDKLFCYDTAVTAHGPFQLKAGPESRQKNTSWSPMRTITSRFPGLPKLLWMNVRDSIGVCRAPSRPKAGDLLHGRGESSVFRPWWAI